MCDPRVEGRGVHRGVAEDRRGRLDGGHLRRRGQATVQLKRIVRPAARIVVLDPQGSILLQRFIDGEKSWWVCPGGGLNDGEDVRDGARREALEELGLEHFELGPEMWHRRHVFPWREQILDQRERFFLVRVGQRFDPCPRIGDERLLAEGVCEQRWWTVDEIDGSSTEFAPRRLAELLRTLLSDGPPAEPFDAGV